LRSTSVFSDKPRSSKIETFPRFRKKKVAVNPGMSAAKIVDLKGKEISKLIKLDPFPGALEELLTEWNARVPNAPLRQQAGAPNPPLALRA
jgi:hypothetical protein